MRVDAARNRARLLAVARSVFTERGARASLNEVAKRAGVGSGTLYRHFPTLQALLVAIVGDDVGELCGHGRDLLGHEDPDTALQTWLRAFVTHASTLQGMLTTQLAAVQFAPADDNALATCHDAILSTGAALLERAQRTGRADPATDIHDVLRLANAIAWAGQQAPDDVGLVDRLFAISLGAGVLTGGSAAPRSAPVAPVPDPERAGS